ncbi:Exodeoxyribonuclease 7 small subunit [Fundidesulfovibrio magnetotacticus]|uniref:Exodeoxyribonuclease 7 small subunit n=1 Tax=Fundidesulfovibrio magnetotacticus TaxID=2730080 RepID=A0A6V8M127_9BACT|nr:exodeoxyribonuclease VII small subunit [Fundidesulfovibrio magnetotacticus]GFK95557.1 Exodeoxyribonuclease 7 small subunit [Fundidesulfovibrio magnetotacticus]
MSAKKPTFEKNIDRLRAIVEQLESGELPLDLGVSLYKEGQTLAASCRTQLEEARLVVSQATPEGLKPFDHAAGEEN